MKTTFFVSHGYGFYLRVFGYGIAFDRDLPILFSERNGYRKLWRVGRYSLQWLRRSELPK